MSILVISRHCKMAKNGCIQLKHKCRFGGVWSPSRHKLGPKLLEIVPKSVLSGYWVYSGGLKTFTMAMNTLSHPNNDYAKLCWGKNSWEGPCQICQFLHVLPCRKEEVAARELWWWYSSNYKTIGIILWHTSFKCTHPFIAILEYLIKPEYPISWYYSSEGQFPIIRPFLANCMP